MENYDWLNLWVNEQHLEMDALHTYRQEFLSHSAHRVKLKSFLHEHVAEKISLFLTTEAVYRQRYGLYSVDGKVTKEEWLKATEAERFYMFGRFAGIAPNSKLSRNGEMCRQFYTAFRDPKFQAFFEAISGLHLSSGTKCDINSLKRGDLVGPHNDTGANRRLACVLYLSPNWKPRFGGALHIVDHNGNTAKVEADYNSMVVFDLNSHKEHYISPVKVDAGKMPRVSIGGWFKNRESIPRIINLTDPFPCELL